MGYRYKRYWFNHATDTIHDSHNNHEIFLVIDSTVNDLFLSTFDATIKYVELLNDDNNQYTKEIEYWLGIYIF